MFKLILLCLLQSILVVSAQTLLKISVELFGAFSFTWAYFRTVFTTWQFFLSGIFAVSSVIVWMYVLKRYEFSIAYPMLSISYVISLLSGYFIFQETITPTRWIGVLIVMAGVILIAMDATK